MSEIMNDFLLKAIHTLSVRTLRTLGFRARVGLTNDSQITGEWATDYRVQASIYDDAGKLEAFIEDLGLLKQREKRLIDLEELLPANGREYLLFLHLIPLRVLAKSTDGVYAPIHKDEFRRLIEVQAHQIEYYRPDGYCAQVLVSLTPFNYTKAHYGNKSSMVLQAPKAFVSSQIQTFLSLINASPDSAYDETHEVECALTDESGRVVTSWKEIMGPFQTRLVDLRAKLLEAGEAFPSPDVKLYTASALCMTGMIFPMLFTHCQKSQTLGLEHTFPPWLYGGAAFGGMRTEINRKLHDSPLFAKQVN